MNLNIYKIKKDKIETLKQWGVSITDNLKEALESIKEENCEEENISTFSIGDDFYIIGIMVPEKGKEILPFNPNREINKKHVKVLRECIEKEIPLETVYFLKR
jgi:hypothetical protein